MIRLIAAIALLVCSPALLEAGERVKIIPQPVSVQESEGEFAVDSRTRIFTYGAGCENSAQFVSGYLGRYYGIAPETVHKSSRRCGARPERNAITLCIDSTVRIDGQRRLEGYLLSVTGKGVRISASDAPGLFYGVQSFLQMLPAGAAENGREYGKGSSSRLSVPCAEIMDYPRFPYRGMHLDVVRHIFPTDYIKKYIDYLAMHKMNRFHWHLTDDQGWRMESLSHPLLNEKGAYREGTIIGIFPGTGVDSTRYGGYYTRDEIRDIISYAADRYITVIPEIDIPGHSMAILATYPEFSTDPDREIKPAITWGMFNRENNVLAPRDGVFEFLKDVFTEAAELFPSVMFHMGADECADKWWKADSLTQQFIREKGLKDENGLQRYFAEYTASVLEACGKEPVAWDEITDYGIPENVTVMCWRKPENGYKAAEAGHKVIMTPYLHSYFNIAQKKDEDSLCHKAWLVTLKDVYDFEPVPDTLSAKAAANIIGGQGAMWTEYFAEEYNVEYAIFPRMSALSEVYWSPASVKSYDRFMRKLLIQRLRYELWGANYFREEIDSYGKGE